MKDNYKLESVPKIKDALIKACIKSRPSYFKPYLTSDKVSNEWPNNESFYIFFKDMVSNSRKMSFGEIYLKLESKSNNINFYKFYDNYHLHPRLTLIVEERINSIHIEVLPF